VPITVAARSKAMYTLDKPRPTNEFVGVDELYVDGVFDRMKDSQHIRWPWSKFAVRAVKSEHIKGSVGWRR
jgi:hypothetical protein